MTYEQTMIRGSTLIKNVWVVLVPSVLCGILVFQILKCGNILSRRNSYLLEDLPDSTKWVWNALSGQLYPHLYAQDDQPGGILAHRMRPFATSEDAMSKKVDLANMQAKWQQDQQGYQKDYRDSVLIPGMPSLTVHYLWCVDGHFEMNHYVTILSALHQFRPDKMIIHYLKKPRSDPHGYWRWLEDLERDIVLLTLKPLQNSRHCSHDLSAGVEENYFPDAHGIFLLGDVAITNLTRPDITRLIAQSFQGKANDNMQSNDLLSEDRLSQSQVFIVSNMEPFHVSQSPGRTVITCPPFTDFNNVKDLNHASCVSIQSYFSTDELLHTDNRFFRFARTLLYGSPDPFHTLKVKKVSIPNILHIVLDEESPKITPLLYISIKSAYSIGKIETVYVHSHKEPSGELWDRLFYSDHLSPVFVPTGSFLSMNRKHASLTYLLYTLLQHGGIGTFGDTVFVKPWPSSHLADVVVSLHRSQYRQKHRSLNTAVLAAVPGSKFVHRLLGMIYQSGSSWPDINPDDVAAHLSEVDTQFITIDSQLTSHQECYGSNCLVAGGHDPPQMVFTTRLIWKNNEPKTTQEMLAVQGPFTKELHELIK